MAKNPRSIIKYKSYSFVEKDPIIDILRTAKKDAGMSDGDIRDASSVSASTLRGWFVGKTKRPTFPTVAAAAVAMGMTTLPITPEARSKYRSSR